MQITVRWTAMQITVKCPGCNASLPFAAAEALDAIRCGRCGRETALSTTDAVRTDAGVDRCSVCSGGDFYVRKDFDPKTGLLFVIAGAAVSAVFYWFDRDVIAYSVLGGAALIDLVIYGRLKDVTVCYRCHTEFRGAYRRTAGAFDLHTADLLEPEWERKTGRR
jgi:ribosomal protein S27E